MDCEKGVLARKAFTEGTGKAETVAYLLVVHSLPDLVRSRVLIQALAGSS